MKIKQGFDNKESEIRIYPRQGERMADLWITQEGIRETLSFLTIDELLDLKKEIENTLKVIINQ